MTRQTNQRELGHQRQQNQRDRLQNVREVFAPQRHELLGRKLVAKKLNKLRRKVSSLRKPNQQRM